MMDVKLFGTRFEIGSLIWTEIEFGICPIF